MQGEVIYKVSFPKPESHYVQVEMEIEKPSGTFTDFIMPVWTPGSYKVREFARNIERLEAITGNEKLVVEKINKYTWRVNFNKGVSKITVTYNVYAFEQGVRTSYVDQFCAFIHGVSVFMYAEGYQNQKCKINYTKLANWKNITVALPESGSNSFTADLYNV